MFSFLPSGANGERGGRSNISSPRLFKLEAVRRGVGAAAQVRPGECCATGF